MSGARGIGLMRTSSAKHPRAMPQAFKVTGHTLVERIGYMPAVHTDYEIVVAFERWEDNRETVENFVE